MLNAIGMMVDKVDSAPSLDAKENGNKEWKWKMETSPDQTLWMEWVSSTQVRQNSPTTIIAGMVATLMRMEIAFYAME